MIKSVVLILHLAEIFAALFRCGSITYNSQLKNIFTIENLEDEIQDMQQQLFLIYEQAIYHQQETIQVYITDAPSVSD